MSNFREKYLKYKAKYMALRTQIGGWSCICGRENDPGQTTCECGRIESTKCSTSDIVPYVNPHIDINKCTEFVHSGNALEEYMQDRLIDFLASFPYKRNVTNINLAKVGMNEGKLIRILQLLASREWQNLCKLNLTGINSESSLTDNCMPSLVEVIRNNRCLTELNLENNDQFTLKGLDILRPAIMENRTLVKIDFKGIKAEVHEDAKDIRACVDANRIEKIQGRPAREVSGWECMCGEVNQPGQSTCKCGLIESKRCFTSDITSGHPNIDNNTCTRILHDGNHLENDMQDRLISFLEIFPNKRNITHINLGRIGMDERRLIRILTLLSSGEWINLYTLNLTGINSESSLTDDCMPLLGNVIRNCKSIKKLVIKENNDITLRGLELLRPFIIENTTLIDVTMTGGKPEVHANAKDIRTHVMENMRRSHNLKYRIDYL